MFRMFTSWKCLNLFMHERPPSCHFSFYHKSCSCFVWRFPSRASHLVTSSRFPFFLGLDSQGNHVIRAALVGVWCSGISIQRDKLLTRKNPSCIYVNENFHFSLRLCTRIAPQRHCKYRWETTKKISRSTRWCCLCFYLTLHRFHVALSSHSANRRWQSCRIHVSADDFNKDSHTTKICICVSVREPRPNYFNLISASQT